MTRSLRTQLGAAVTALALSACGGGNAGSGALPGAAAQPPQTASGTVRHASSTCTPDSYGYCLKLLRVGYGPIGECRSGSSSLMYRATTYTYQLYHNGVADSTYDHSNADGGGAGCPPALVWTPEDPRAATGDPNLP